MAIVTSRTSLSQGAETAETVQWTASAGQDTVLTGTGLPVVAATDFFELRGSTLTQNNGLYIATGTPTTSNIPCTKVNGAGPTNVGPEAATWLGDTTTFKSVFIDTAGLGIYLLEKGNLSVDGATGQAVYSFLMQEFKDDDFLIANAPFPMLTIDADAGKFIIGQDISGNNNGFNWVDNGTHSIRTRKLMRNAGWDEVDANGNTTARYVGIVTLGSFEAPTTDVAYYQFGTDTTVDDTLDFDFAGPVNEAVGFFAEQAQTDLAITATTITRVGGSFITEGYKVGGQVTVRNANTGANDGTWDIDGVSATVITTSGLTIDATDTVAILAVNNDNAMTLRLRVRDADPEGKTFGQANLASAGKTILGNFVFAFPLANSTDLKITVTDVGIDADSNGVPDVAPYTGMTITYEAAPQARTDLVGGSVNFGIIVEGNSGTAEQVFEFLQWSLRSTGGNGSGDIDNGAEVAIGRAMDGLARFVGDTGEFGSTDGGLSVPSNPDGGGSGVYIDNLAASSKNSVVFYDNLGNPKTFPETISVTLDFNQIAIDDTTAEYDLFYDRTTRNNVTDFDLATTAGGTITGTGLPDTTGTVVGSYIRVTGLTGADAAMNGIYQIVTESVAGSDWIVTRYDGVTIVAVTGPVTVDMDQNCIDTPDAILVHTNVRVAEAAAADRPGSAVLDFASPDTINDSGNTLAVFSPGMIIEIEGTTGNDGVYEVDTAAAGVLTIIEQTLVTEAVGVDTTGVITEAVSGLASADIAISYDFDNNIQGDRGISSTTFVKAKAIGSTGAQYIQSTVQSIISGTPLIIPVAPATERNYA